MKKSIICILPMALALLSAGAFRFMKWHEKQVPAVVVSPMYWGLKVSDFSDDGSNSVFITLLKKDAKGAYVGNILKTEYTFHF